MLREFVHTEGAIDFVNLRENLGCLSFFKDGALGKEGENADDLWLGLCSIFNKNTVRGFFRIYTLLPSEF